MSSPFEASSPGLTQITVFRFCGFISVNVAIAIKSAEDSAPLRTSATILQLFSVSLGPATLILLDVMSGWMPQNGEKCSRFTIWPIC